MKHKHAEFIHAWADGAEIEYTPIGQQDWKPIFAGWSWENSLVAMYRIKPEPKPDPVKKTMYVYNNGMDGKTWIDEWSPDEKVLATNWTYLGSIEVTK